ncbi:hypothetical protein LTR85_003191 [Meristemomyces frigidus]|nr:hypothetical protein LTR85_003191 [Meristemomyces frigidus]
MSSPEARRSVSRGRTRTPANIKTEDDAPMDDAPNGARDHSRSRTRSRSASQARSRTRSPRDRSYSRSLTRSPTRSPSPAVPQSAKIVIEKLTKNVNEGHLREIFSTYGDIQELEMPMNKQFMMNKGIAYILYAEARYAESAIAHMHEAQLDGALINVSIVLPRRRFSRSPPPKRPPPNRFGEPHRLRDGPPPRGPPADRAFGGRPPPRASPGYGGRGGRSPPPRFGRGRGGGAGGGYRDRFDDRDSYRPRSISPSRSPPPRRRRSPSYDSRSRSPRRSPPGRRDASPPGGGRRRRSPSYSSYGSRSPSGDRSRNQGGSRR